MSPPPPPVINTDALLHHIIQRDQRPEGIVLVNRTSSNSRSRSDITNITTATTVTEMTNTQTDDRDVLFFTSSSATEVEATSPPPPPPPPPLVASTTASSTTTTVVVVGSGSTSLNNRAASNSNEAVVERNTTCTIRQDNDDDDDSIDDNDSVPGLISRDSTSRHNGSNNNNNSNNQNEDNDDSDDDESSTPSMPGLIGRRDFLRSLVRPPQQPPPRDVNGAPQNDNDSDDSDDDDSIPDLVPRGYPDDNSIDDGSSIPELIGPNDIGPSNNSGRLQPPRAATATGAAPVSFLAPGSARASSSSSSPWFSRGILFRNGGGPGAGLRFPFPYYSSPSQYPFSITEPSRVKCPTCQVKHKYTPAVEQQKELPPLSKNKRRALEHCFSHDARVLFHSQITCPICLDVVEAPEGSQEGETPVVVVLPCGHTLCPEHFERLNGKIGENAMRSFQDQLTLERAELQRRHDERYNINRNNNNNNNNTNNNSNAVNTTTATSAAALNDNDPEMPPLSTSSDDDPDMPGLVWPRGYNARFIVNHGPRDHDDGDDDDSDDDEDVDDSSDEDDSDEDDDSSDGSMPGLVPARPSSSSAWMMPHLDAHLDFFDEANNNDIGVATAAAAAAPYYFRYPSSRITTTTTTTTTLVHVDFPTVGDAGPTVVLPSTTTNNDTAIATTTAVVEENAATAPSTATS